MSSCFTAPFFHIYIERERERGSICVSICSYILLKPSNFAMSLEHFSHEHPLILKEELDVHGDEEIVCHGCPNKIKRGSDVFTCSIDNFYLHKTCAELPKEIKHRMHQQHPLTLHARPHYESCRCICNVCKRVWEWFTYSCISCQFDSCVTCGFEDREFRHNGHKQHTLTLMQRSAMFTCDACGTEATDLSYACNSCGFWMHKSCASSPTTVEPNFHHHPLFLIYSVPDIHLTFSQYCGICKKQVHPSYWLYYCAKCTFFVHMKCAASLETLTSGEKEEDNLQRDVDETNLVQFSVRCKKSFMDLIIDQFAKRIINLEEGGEALAAAPVPQTINHWSHRDHPLILLEEVRSSEDGDEMLVLCNGCVQPVSTPQPFYGCIGCNFFLHRFCAELPIELPTGPHSCHPQHPLVIRMYDKFNTLECHACGLFTNGLFFECEECNIRFDICCCFLPNRIKHESHKHPLVNCAPLSIFAWCCYTCESRWRSDIFKCEISSCSYEIHKACALLPSIIRHRWDPHPISLMYPPFFHEGVLYCEICEERINPNFGLYHCRECDQSFHTRCLCPGHNVKLGDKLVVGIHRHTLTFVLKEMSVYRRIYCRPFLCCSCGKDEYSGKYRFIFECASCDFLLCVTCALGPWPLK